MFMAPRDQCIHCWELDAVAAGNLDLAREALVPELGSTSEVCLAPLFDLEALQLRETVVEDVALAVVALVRAALARNSSLHCHLASRSARRSARMSGRPNANAKRAGVGINCASASAFLASARAARSWRRPGSPNAVVKILGTWMFVKVWPPCATWFPPPRDGAGAADLPKPPKAVAPTARARMSFILLTLCCSFCKTSSA